MLNAVAKFIAPRIGLRLINLDKIGMDLKSFTQAIQQIADEKGIAKEKIIETIEMALSAAYKRDYGKRGQIVKATLDPASGKAAMRQIKVVVDETMIKTEEEVLAEEEERMQKLAAASEGAPHPLPTAQSAEDELSAKGEGEKRVRFNEEKHIMLAEAKKIKHDAAPGDELEFQLEGH